MCFLINLFSIPTVLDTVSIPQTKTYSLFLSKFFRFNYEFIWKKLDQNCFKDFPNFFTQQEILAFSIKEENVFSKYLYLVQINTDVIKQLELSATSITQPISLNKPFDSIKDEIRPSISMVSGKNFC